MAAASPVARALAVLLLAAGALASVGAHARDAVVPPAASAAPFQPVVVEVCVNGATPCATQLLWRDGAGALYADADALVQLRLLPPPGALEDAGRVLFPLAALRGARLDFDPEQQRLALEVAAEAFVSFRATGAPPLLPPIGSGFGAFADYDLTALHARGARGTSGAGLVDAGLHAGTTALRSSFTFLAGDGTDRLLRGETRLVRDWPDAMRRLVVGDAISDPGGWGGALRFGGVQLSRNFATQPWLVTTPLLAARGSAVVPSTVDVFVNGRRVASTEVPPGPFEIERLPAMVGSGELTVVTRDAFGREQLLSQPFYSSPRLLAPGLSDWSVSAGRVRRGLADAEAEYGERLLAATWRQGLGERATLEVHGEGVAGFTRAVGAELALQLREWGVVTLTGAGSAGAGRDGMLAALGVERRTERGSIALRALRRSADFRGAGDLDAARVLRERLVASAGVRLASRLTLNLGAAADEYGDGTRARSATAALAWSPRFGHFSLLLTRSDAGAVAEGAYLSFTRPLGPRASATLGASHARQPDPTRAPRGDAGTTRATAALQHSPPPGAGAGYQLRLASDGDYDASAEWRHDYGSAAVETQRVGRWTASRATLRGALIAFGGELHAARSVERSYALVDADGLEGVTVFLENQRIGRTGPDGRLLVEGLRAWEPNRLSIDPTELPLDVQLASDQLLVRPAERAGVLVQLPLTRRRAATFRLQQVDGLWVPAGAQLRLGDADAGVGFDGLVFVESAREGLAGVARWDGGGCRFVLGPASDAGPHDDHGTVRCAP